MLVLKFHLLKMLLFEAVVLCHVQAMTSTESAMMSWYDTRRFSKIFLLNELQFGVGQIRIAQVTVGRRVKFVDEIQRIFYHKFFEVGWVLRFEMELIEVDVADGTDGIG